MGDRVKRQRLPEEMQVTGTVVEYDGTQGSGWIDVGEGERAKFSRATLARHGFSRIKLGAIMDCTVAPVNGVKVVVYLFRYRLPKQQPPPSRRQHAVGV